MDKILLNIQEMLRQIADEVMTVMPNDEATGIAYKNWGFPGLSRVDLADEARSIINLIEERGITDLGNHAKRLQDFEPSLQFLLKQTVPKLVEAHTATAITAYLFTLSGLRRVLETVLAPDGQAAEVSAALRTTLKRVRGFEAQLNSLQPRADSLQKMVKRIEDAYDAADRLPADLESLAENRQKVDGIVQNSLEIMDDIKRSSENARERLVEIGNIKIEADDVLKRCKTAYAASTSMCLADAFSERSTKLSRTVFYWVFALAASLAVGGYFGSEQLHKLSGLFNVPDYPASMVVVNLLLAVISVGAPVWFAWLATKQIGQRFRLAEDYAFKATISRAYEGFRQEASRIDKDLEVRLLESALTRYDELPLRLVETASHGSPWHELASSDVVKQALKTIPDFQEKVTTLACTALDTARQFVQKSDSSKVSQQEARTQDDDTK